MIKIKILKTVSIFSLIFTLLISGSKSHAIGHEIFFDEFNDANPDGWARMGNWCIKIYDSIHVGVFTHREDGNISKALVEDLILSDQIVQTDLYIRDGSSVAGIILWFKDLHNFVEITIDPITDAINIEENILGNITKTAYPYISDPNTWYDFKIEADSNNGILDVYINNTYLFSHSVISNIRTGNTGLHNNIGNAYFDDFTIKTDIRLNNKDMCKDYGWQKFFDPVFKNQGQCVLYALSDID